MPPHAVPHPGAPPPRHSSAPPRAAPTALCATPPRASPPRASPPRLPARASPLPRHSGPCTTPPRNARSPFRHLPAPPRSPLLATTHSFSALYHPTLPSRPTLSCLATVNI
ncbi:Protein of unknown function [Gryllus bimaculatus]|nr:Protein of unknown function [Gryllus bimaculatus]